jgi:hypothetical protein
LSAAFLGGDGLDADRVRQDVMAERFYFHLVRAGETIEDETGVLAESLAHAEAEAMKLIAEFRADGDLPDPAERWHMEIHDANGVLLRTLQLF